jgi:tRNA C32,U32 (ribose-2'-O)-methylase TrmJ
MKILRILACCLLVLTSVELFAQTDLDGQQKQIEAQLQALLQRYSPSHPEAQALMAQLQALRKEQAGIAPVAPLKGTSSSPLTTLQATVKGTFWRNPEWITLLELSADQQKKMDDIFQQHRLRLVDLTASLQKEELTLEPLLSGTKPSPDTEAKIMSQVDRIAEARAELEKANSRMLVNILQVLNVDQWNKLPLKPKKNLWPPSVKWPTK